jgi:recombination protein RecA
MAKPVAKGKKTEPVAPALDKKQALENAIAQIERTYGEGSIMKLGQTKTLNVDVIPTGSLGLDLALGVGGVPKGRIIEIYGPESSGKTTVALQMVAQAQKLGGEAAFIDVEHALDPEYAKALGVNIDSLLVSQPDTGEQAMEITEALVRSGAIDIVVVDSVAAMVTKAEIEGEMGESHVGLQARLMSQAMRKLTSIIGKSQAVAIFINQIREKIGVMYGNPETTTGGRALKYYATIRIDVRKGEAIKDGSEVIGNVTRCKVVKNKVAPPFKEVSFDLMYGEGTSREGELIDIGSVLGCITKSGAWYSYNGERIGQGKEKARQFLKDHPEIAASVEEVIRANKDKLLFVAGKSSKSVIELRKGERAELSLGEDQEPVLAVPIEDASADALTDIALDVEADLEDFE